MNRRSFLRNAAVVVGGAALLPAACGMPGSEAQPAMAVQPGIQLYTLRDVMGVDPAAVLHRLSEIGYKEVETFSYHGQSPAGFRAMLDDAGLKAPAAHVGYTSLRDDIDHVIEAAEILGHQYVILAHPGALPHSSLEDYRAIGDFLSTVGRRMSDAGIRFGYHNHGFEFEPIDGQIPFFVMMDHADSDHVVIELDLYWAVDGGVDPVQVIERYPGRVHAYHIKDRSAAGEMVDVGDGAIDFRGIFQFNSMAGLRHAFLEHDNPSDSIETAHKGYAALSELLR